MDGCRAAAPSPAFHPSSLPRPEKMDADDPEPAGDEELAVFTAERYFYGDDGDVPWCARSASASSSFSSALRTGALGHDRSAPTPTAATATSSSEASWNSRSALLPSERPDKSHAAAATPIAEADPAGAGAESERSGRKPAASSSLRRWLLGVAGCACAGGDGEESVAVSAGETEAGDDVLGAGGKKRSAEAVVELFPTTDTEEAASATVRLGSGRWLGDGGGAFLGGREAFRPVQLAGNSGHRRAAHSGELSTPILRPGGPAAAATSDERRRRSFEMPLRVAGRGSALTSAAQDSVVTIVAGNAVQPRAPHAATAAGAGSPGDPRVGRRDSGEDGAAPSELGRAYPPSEASVVWSVVTADGAASGDFSSAASGYYYHYLLHNGEDGASRKSSRRRRSGITGSGGGLLTCMSEKAADAVGPAPSVHRSEVKLAAVARLGAAGGRRNGPCRSRRA